MQETTPNFNKEMLISQSVQAGYSTGGHDMKWGSAPSVENVLLALSE
jgi:hypothetical protein